MSTELPSWADYTVTTGTEEAAWLEQGAAVHLGGLRIMDLGDGRVALDAEAVRTLRREPEDADGCIDDDMQMWIAGAAWPVSPAGA